MLPCNEVRELAEEYVRGTLDLQRRAAVARHLRVCQPCHRTVEEARLACRILDQTQTPLPPPNLSARIKSAATMQLTWQSRPLHERALGSPAFLATCASLLCGAVICLMAILKVATIQPLPPSEVQVAVVETIRLPARHYDEARHVQRPRPSVVRLAARRLQPPDPVALAEVVSPSAPRAPRPVAMALPRPRLAQALGGSGGPTITLAAEVPTSAPSAAGARVSAPENLQAVAATPRPMVSPLVADDGHHASISDLSLPIPVEFTSSR